MSKKRERERIPKEERRNLRLWAEGAREEILTPHLDMFAAARTKGSHCEKEYLQRVCNEFHARVDWRLLDHQEPVLKPWTADTIITKEVLPDEEEKQKRARIEELNARIHRWYTYRIRRLLKHRRSGLDPSKDPYAVLLGKLSGLSTPPKARQAYQQFMREAYTDRITPIVAQRWEAKRETMSGLSKEPKAGFRAEVARQVFAALAATERAAFAERAKEEAAAAKSEYLAALKRPPSTAPKDRQVCIDAAGDFLAPILRGLEECTGLHTVVLMGGPMPKYAGELRTKHISYGRNGTAATAHFPQWDKKRFADNVVKFFIEYLQTAFSKEDCAAAALPDILANAKYTMSKETGTDLGSDSDSESDSDSGSESDEETPPKKKAKLTVSYTAAAPKKPTAKKRKGREDTAVAPPPAPPAGPSGTSSGSVSSPSLSSGPAPSSPPSSAAGTTGSASAPSTSLGPALSSPPSSPAAGTSPAVSPTRDLSPTPDGGYGYYLTPAQREVRVAEVKKQMQALGEKFREAMAVPEKAPRAPRKKVVGAEPTRRSSRVAKGGDGGDATAIPVVPSAVPPPPSLIPTATMPPPPSLVPPATLPHHSDTVGPSLERGVKSPAPPPSMTADNDQQGVNHAPAPASTAAAPLQDTAGSSGDADVLMADVPAATIFPPPPSSLVPCPAKAAEWFCHARLELTRRDLGPHFAAILNAWTRIEAASRFEHSESNLPHKGRPAQVGRWTAAQRRARPADISITDLAKYAVQWRAWWGSLQPVWRSKGVDGQWDIGGSYGSEWGDLFQWGVNGVLSLLAALYFWGCAVLDVPEANEAQVWELEVQDVGWMLEGLAVYYERKDWKF